MEVYMDDLLIKSREPEHHLNDLQESFAVLHQYKIKLNLAKCTFG